MAQVYLLVQVNTVKLVYIGKFLGLVCLVRFY